jgi:hypothetical protein
MVEKLEILVRNSCLERTGKELVVIVFTLHPSLANLDKQGVWRGEEVLQLFTTLHHLFSISPEPINIRSLSVIFFKKNRR